MAAFNVHEFTTPPDTAELSYRTPAYLGYSTQPQFGGSNGPIPFVTRYSEAGSVAFLYVQTDRVLVTSGAMTTVGNYVLSAAGVGSPPTVTAVTFTTGKSYIRLTLSGVLNAGYQWFLTVAANTFNSEDDSSALSVAIPFKVFNVATAIPIYLDATPGQSGISQTVTLGSPAMSHT